MKCLPLLVFASCCTAAFAQTPAPVTSPEITPDRHVIFRLAAPNAHDVSFKSDWMPTPTPMVRDGAGNWSITVGPLEPATYIYGFVVDGVATADPVNPQIKLRMAGSGSLVTVPGTSPGLTDARDVPHGAIEINWARSTVLGDTQPIWVYTPPGYHDSSSRLPVLYLMHGSNDRPAGWIDVGHLQFIADNLIAEKKMVPMVIVMPVAHALPFGAPAAENTAKFATYFEQDVLPYVEKRYRIAADRKHRAIGGMSMGGGQALHLFFEHLDQFNAVGAFSPAPYDLEQAGHGDLLANSEATNAKIAVLWLAAGKQESPRTIEGVQSLSGKLTAHHIQHTLRLTDGAHNYALWTQNLAEFLPLLFEN